MEDKATKATEDQLKESLKKLDEEIQDIGLELLNNLKGIDCLYLAALAEAADKQECLNGIQQLANYSIKVVEDKLLELDTDQIR